MDNMPKTTIAGTKGQAIFGAGVFIRQLLSQKVNCLIAFFILVIIPKCIKSERNWSLWPDLDPMTSTLANFEAFSPMVFFLLPCRIRIINSCRRSRNFRLHLGSRAMRLPVQVDLPLREWAHPMVLWLSEVRRHRPQDEDGDAPHSANQPIHSSIRIVESPTHRRPLRTGRLSL